MDDKIRLILDVSSELANERDLNSILIKLTDVTKRIMNADRCSIFLHDRSELELWTIVAHGVEEIRIPDNHGIAGHVFQTKETMNIEDAYKDPRFDKEVDLKTGYKTKSILCVPLKDRVGAAIGVFQVINKIDNTPYTKEDIDILVHLTLYASATLENVMLYDNLKKANSKLRKANEEIVYRLANATRFKDPETENHIIRVGLYCRVMAKYLGWDDEEAELIKLAAPMHDIGKVGVPDHILLKPGKLTDEEWVVMRKHTEFGNEILRDSESRLLQVAAIAALQHHEKWNGKGYPSGKRENEISIYGRLTAIADVFDALTSRRHYKEAWTYEDTLELIKEEKGEHFDPDLVDIFAEHYDEFIKIKSEYKDE